MSKWTRELREVQVTKYRSETINWHLSSTTRIMDVRFKTIVKTKVMRPWPFPLYQLGGLCTDSNTRSHKYTRRLIPEIHLDEKCTLEGLKERGRSHTQKAVLSYSRSHTSELQPQS